MTFWKRPSIQRVMTFWNISFESQSRDLLHASFVWACGSLHASLYLSIDLLCACLESQSLDLLHAGFDKTLTMFVLASTGQHFSLVCCISILDKLQHMVDEPFKRHIVVDLRGIHMSPCRRVRLTSPFKAHIWPLQMMHKGDLFEGHLLEESQTMCWKKNLVEGGSKWKDEIFKDACCQVQTWYTGQNCCIAVLKHCPILAPK